MELKHVILDVTDFVATVTLNRPPVNALNLEIRQEITALFDALNDRQDVRAVILTGHGRNFCAGADIKERAAMNAASAPEPGLDRRLNRVVREMFYSLLECTKPVIAAVNGPALGAGFALCLSCDILMAADDAVFGMPEVDVGVAGGVKFLQRHFWPSKARRLLLTGQRIAAPELYRLGMIEESLPPAKLMPAALALAREIASKSPLAVTMLKQSFNMVENLSLRDGYRLEQDVTVELGRTEDAREAKRAFIEKRKPVFVGR